MTAPSVHAAIYLRQSMDRTGEGLAVDRQRSDAETLVKLRGWDVVRVEVDNDISAAGKKHRPGFEAILTAVESGEVGAVIAWDMTRLLRNLRDMVRVIEAGERHKTVLAFCRGSDLDLSTPMGRGMAGMLATMARMEIEQKSDRQKLANEQRAQQGRRSGGRRPFGYEPDGVTIRDVEAEVIVRAYDDVLAGVSLAQIARDWNAAGLHTPQSTRAGGESCWIPSTARDVLMNPRNAGLRGYGPAPEHGRRKWTDLYPAEWPGLISEGTWRATVDLLSDPDRFTARHRRARFLLTGVALCGVCGATVNAGGSNRPGHRIYRCSESYGHVQRAAVPVEEWVSEVAIARLSGPMRRSCCTTTNGPTWRRCGGRPPRNGPGSTRSLQSSWTGS